MSHTSFVEERAAGIITCARCGHKFLAEQVPCGCFSWEQGNVTNLAKARGTASQKAFVQMLVDKGGTPDR